MIFCKAFCVPLMFAFLPENGIIELPLVRSYVKNVSIETKVNRVVFYEKYGWKEVPVINGYVPSLKITESKDVIEIIYDYKNKHRYDQCLVPKLPVLKNFMKRPSEIKDPKEAVVPNYRDK